MTVSTVLQRLGVLLSVLAYALAFNLTYQAFVSRWFTYFGFAHNPPPPSYQVLAWVLIIIPALWLPTRLERPSLLLFHFQYFVVYIPTMFILYQISRPQLALEQTLVLVVYMFIGLSIMQSVYYIKLVDIYRRSLSLNRRLFWGLLALLMLLCLGYVFLLLGQYFRLVNFRDVYDLRAETFASSNQVSQYAVAWSAGVFLPMMFALGSLYRRWWLLPLVLAGYVFLYGIGGAKGTLLATVFLPLVYFWAKFFRAYASQAFAWGLTVLTLLPFALLIVAVPDFLRLWYIALVNMRTLSLQAHNMAMYVTFFQDNPLTYMSHIRGISSLIDYPYAASLPYLMQETFGAGRANAGFWATDGVASFGPSGILVASVFAGIALWLVDVFSSKHDPVFVALALTYIAAAFVNVGLFTTFLTGGLGLLLLIFYFSPPQGQATSLNKVIPVAGPSLSEEHRRLN